VGERRVKDIMYPLQTDLTIGVEDSLASAVKALTGGFSESGTAGVLVVGAGHKPVGLFTFQEIFKAISPKTLSPEKHYGGWNISGFVVKPLMWEGLFTRRCKEEMKSPVYQWMRDLKEVSIADDETLMSAAEKFARSGSAVLVVFCRDCPVGLLSADAVMNEICLLMESLDNDSYKLTS